MKQTPMVIEVCFIFSVSLLDVILHSLRQLLQCLAKYASLRGNIQSHESLAARSEHLTIIQCQVSLVDEEVKELVVVKMQVTAVEPYQEGSLWAKRSNAWDMPTTEILHKLNVLFDVSQHLLAPFLTLTESGDSSDRCEERRLIQLIGYQPSIELLANFLIRNDGIAANQSCNIEGLGRSLEGDTDVTSLVRHRGKRNMLMSEDGKVGMDFIRDDKQVMLVAEVSQTLQPRIAIMQR